MAEQSSAVDVRDISVSYRGRPALDRASFQLQPGVTGLLGPNGAGKTTLLRVLATAIPADQGELSLLGQDPRTTEGKLAIRRRLGYLPQDPGFHPNFTALDFVDYVAILKEVTETKARRSEVLRVLEAVGLSEQRGKRIKTLSGGMRQRVALAAALIGDPALLILDEPTVGLDPEQRLRFREIVADLGEDRTILLSTHQTEDVSALCQRVIVLDKGVVKFEGVPSDLVAVAAGRVWSSSEKDNSALAGWRTGEGTFRNIGSPPRGAKTIAPALEDGYLLLLDGTLMTNQGAQR